MVNKIWGFFIIFGLIFSCITGNLDSINSEILSCAKLSLDMIIKILPVMALWLGIQTCVLGAMGAWYAFQTGVEAVCLGVLSIFQGLYNGVVWLVNRNNSSVEQNTRSANRYR